MATVRRSLTPRQRQLIQEYADDIDGVNSRSAGGGSGGNNKHGMDSFSSSARPAKDWLSGAWDRLKGLIGY